LTATAYSRSGSQQLTSGFSGANIGMASAQLGGQ
jgi:hypothetical protein